MCKEERRCTKQGGNTMYAQIRDCVDCGEEYEAHTKVAQRCPRCQKAHREESRKTWASRTRKGKREVELNPDANFEYAIYCG